MCTNNSRTHTHRSTISCVQSYCVLYNIQECNNISWATRQHTLRKSTQSKTHNRITSPASAPTPSRDVITAATTVSPGRSERHGHRFPHSHSEELPSCRVNGAAFTGLGTVPSLPPFSTVETILPFTIVHNMHRVVEWRYKDPPGLEGPNLYRGDVVHRSIQHPPVPRTAVDFLT